MANKLEKIFRIHINFGDSEKQIPEVGKKLQSLHRRLINILEAIRNIGQATGLKQAAEAVKAYDATVRDAEKSKKNLIAADQKEQAQNKAAKSIIERLSKSFHNLTFTKRELATIQRNYITLANSEKGSVEELQAKVNILNIAWKKMGATQRQTVEGKKVTSDLRILREEIRKLTMAAGDNSRNIGNYISGIYNAFTGKIAAITGIVYTAKRALYTLFEPYQALEYRMSMVRAVSGATDEEFVSLEQNARRLGATTEYTATQVAGLQLAYSRMGFVPSQIIEITGATLDLATATGEDLAKSADVVGTTLKGFNLKAGQTKRVVDVMTKSFNSSSLQLDYFYEAMKYVAPIASVANVSLEETTAMLGVLADRGIRGSQAGTALRRILTEIAKEGGTVSERLDKLNKEGLTLSGAMDEVGRYAMTALTVLVNSKDGVNDLAAALENASGSAQETADVMRDNIWGDVKIFLSAVEEKLIAVGEFLAPMARKVLQLGTTAVSNLKSIVLAISAYIGITKSLTLAKTAYIAVVKLAYGSTINFGRAILKETAAMTIATGVTRTWTAAKLLLSKTIKVVQRNIIGLWRVIVANPIGLIVTAVAAAVSAFVFFRKDLDPTTRAQKKLNDEIERFNKLQDEKRSRIESLIRTIQDETETEYAKIRAYDELSGISSRLASLYSREELATLKLADAQRILNDERDKERYDYLIAQVRKYSKALKENKDARDKVIGEAKSSYEQAGAKAKYDEEINRLNRELKVYQDEINKILDARRQAAENAKPIEIRIKAAEDIAQQAENAFHEAEAAYRQKRDKWIREYGTEASLPFYFRYDMLQSKKEWEEAQAKVAELKKQKEKQKQNESTGSDKEKGEWSLSKDKEHNRLLLELKQQLHRGEIASEEEYQRQVLTLEIATLTRRIALNTDEAKVVMKLRQELADKLLEQDKATKKESETYAANRRSDEDAMLKYANERRKAEINAMKDGLHKKLLLNGQSASEAEQNARRELRIKLESLNKEQKTYKEGSDEYLRIEQLKVHYAQLCSDKIISIVSAGATEQTKILQAATKEQLQELLKIPAYAVAAWQALQALKAKTANEAGKKTVDSVNAAQSQFSIDESIADATLGLTGRKRQVAKLENEINLRKALAQAYQQELEVLGKEGLQDTARYKELLQLFGQIQEEATNLGKGRNADGSRKSFMQQMMDLTDEEVNQLKQQAIDVATQIGQAVIGIQKQTSERRLKNEKKAIEAQYKVQSKLLDDRRDKGLISEKKYQKELEKLEEEKAEREEATERAAFEREKKLNIAQAWMNVANGILKIWAEAGINPFKLPIAAAQVAFLTAEGVAQTALIASQKYAQGGILPVGDKMGVIKGRSHAQGGHRIYLDGRPIGEVEGDELIAIVNKRDTARIGALSAANSVHGKRFAQGGLMTPSRFRTTSAAPPVSISRLAANQDALLRKQVADALNAFREDSQITKQRIEATDRRIDRIKVVLVTREAVKAQEELKKVEMRNKF